MTDFYEKYLKYKNKYIQLSTQLNLIQQGGAFPFAFGDCEILYLMAKIEGDTLDRINERRRTFGLVAKDDLHISLLQLYVNNKHPYYPIFTSQEFKQNVIDSYNRNIVRNHIVLESVTTDPTTGVKKGLWEFLGRDPNKFWTRVYSIKPEDKPHLTRFRLDIYNFINTMLGQPTHKTERRGKEPDVEDFEVYSYEGQELYAINKSFYYGIENWKPHVSVLTVNELDSYDQSLMHRFHAARNDEEKTDILRSRFVNVQPISYIKLDTNVERIKYSLNNPKTKTKNEEYLGVR